MHIAFFLPALNSGGAEKSFVMLAEYFAAQGVRVDLLVVKEEGAYLTQTNLNIIELGGRGMARSVVPLVQYLKAVELDCLISGLPGPNVVALLAKRLVKRKTRFMITQHHPFTENAAASKKLRTSVRTMLARSLFKQADSIVAVSHGVADDLAQAVGIPRTKIQTIHNPVALEDISARAEEPTRHEWLSNKTQPVFLSVGRLAAPKDYETLLQALARVSNARLLILGEGSERHKIETLITALDLGDRVQLLGFQKNPYKYIKAADALILSSRHEGFGNVLIEALALGTQIIASDCPYGPAEITQKGQVGTLVPVGNVEALTQAMEASEKIPEGDLKARAEDFTLEKIAAQYDVILKMSS